MPEPIRCWCWSDGVYTTRKTAPSIHWIRDIIDSDGIGVNGYGWARVQPIGDGHPDAATDAALEEFYVTRWQEKLIRGIEVKQPRPSALSRIWAILRGRG
ncbi:MAG TPA: hypothetical protein PKO15_12760 [Fibrobacteria bacterium]|nr:hypothetical protein [Fibrobacteria bacterium]